MDYRHRYIDGTLCSFPPGKAVCVGRNYADHIRELQNETPDSPLLFLKPATAFQALQEPIRLPCHGKVCHHEVEIALLIGKHLQKATASKANDSIAGYGIALDLTLRDVQQKCRQKGHPWEIAKGFDGSCPISPFISPDHFGSANGIPFRLSVNGTVRQTGNSDRMIAGFTELLIYASSIFTLVPGDVLLTGTPAGVDSLKSGDRLELELKGEYLFETYVS